MKTSIASTNQAKTMPTYSPPAGTFVKVEHVVFVPGAVNRHERKLVDSFITQLTSSIPDMLKAYCQFPIGDNWVEGWEPTHTSFEPYPTLGANAWISNANHVFFVTPAEDTPTPAPKAVDAIAATSLATARVAFEWGYRCAEQHMNIQAALERFDKQMK